MNTPHPTPATLDPLVWGQNGIHATPTFMLEGLVAAEISSGDSVDVWLEKLGLS